MAESHTGRGWTLLDNNGQYFVGMLFAHISWNPIVFTAILACFYSFPHHPLSPFSLRISSGTWDCFLQSIRGTASILCVDVAFFHLCVLLPRSRQPWPSRSCHVLVPSVFTEAQLWMQRSIKHRAAIQSDLIETVQIQRRYFSTAAHLYGKAALSLQSAP